MKKLLLLVVIGLLTSCKMQKSSVTKTTEVMEVTGKQMIKEDKEKYAVSIKEAWKLYEQKDYVNSAKKYQVGFDAIGGKAFSNDRYNASCSYSLAGNSERAFYHLFRLANDSKYSNLGHITTDTDLNFLYKDKQWNQLITIVKTNKIKKEKDLDKPLVIMLDSIFQKDQKYRNQYGTVLKKHGKDSKEVKELLRLNKESDSLNLLQITKLLDEKGWLGKNIIGGMGNATLFLVIQHSDIDTQLKYMPMMKDAVLKGNANSSSLALLQDRVALGQGKRQIYGSQIHSDIETQEKYVAPLIDPKNVDKRRAEVGLGKLKDYIGHWDLVWDVKKHIERTAKIEAENIKK
ncbi:MAG: hypothetical protein COB98_05265 [Flavobacteriaceae bacterium]|nr:MAG: hypothetical protein COB98_05265 [Flavobacteriaceae bacterium]